MWFWWTVLSFFILSMLFLNSRSLHTKNKANMKVSSFQITLLDQFSEGVSVSHVDESCRIFKLSKFSFYCLFVIANKRKQMKFPMMKKKNKSILLYNVVTTNNDMNWSGKKIECPGLCMNVYAQTDFYGKLFDYKQNIHRKKRKTNKQTRVHLI